jgi:putative methyltransferase
MSSSPYAPAAKILNQVWTERRGLKSVVYNPGGELTCSKATFAQCSHVLQSKEILDRLVEEVVNVCESKIQAKNEGLLYVLLYELLMGPNRAIRGGGALKRHLLTLHEALQQKLLEVSPQRDEKEDLSSGNKDSDRRPEPRTTIPRYVRINTLKADRESVIEQLRGATTQLYLDPHVPDLLVLDPTAESRALLQDLVVSNRVVLQDKSSCFSALCLVHGFDDEDGDRGTAARPVHYLDACAAPGNKTSHLAALVHDRRTGTRSGDDAGRVTIHALDKSPDRYKLLRRRMEELTGNAGGGTVEVDCHNLDFLQQQKRRPSPHGPSSHQQPEGGNGTKRKRKASHRVDGTDVVNAREDHKFEHVRAILLDPTCSGSGMTGNHHTEGGAASMDPQHSDDRVRSLSDFQFHALKHALTGFPHADRVVYSTCSIYVEENEAVVGRVLQALEKDSGASDRDDSDNAWEVVAPKCLRGWHRRGIVPTQQPAGDDDQEADERPPPSILTPDQAKCMIRADPRKDGTNGFFVACLQRRRRKPQGESSRKPQQKKKTKEKKGEASSMTTGSAEWKSPAERDLPEGIELYDNQFDTICKARADSSTDNKVASRAKSSSATSKAKNGSIKAKAEKTAVPPKSGGQKKRKAEDSTSSLENRGDADTSHLSKKRAKKAEWKVKQRLKKEARLKGKTPS